MAVAGSSTGSGITLAAERNVDFRDGHAFATSDEPWLALTCPVRAWAGRLIEVRYRASLLDEPARPIFRFRLRDGTAVDRIGAAPVVGAGIWVGRVPADTTGISVSPTNQRGAFSFRIEGVKTLQWLALLARAFRSRPRAARSTLLTRLVGWKPEADVNLAWAISSSPLRDYAAWCALRARAFEPDGIDRPRFDWSTAAPVRIVIIGHDKDALRRSVDSLLAQEFAHWRAFALGALDGDAASDRRIAVVSAQELPGSIRKESDGALICILRAGDVLLPHTLAYVSEQAERCPTHALFYGDVIATSGFAAETPVFQPGWSPHLQNESGYLVPPFFVRRGKIEEGALVTFLLSGRLDPGWLRGLSSSDVKPLRRILAKTMRFEDLSSRPPPVPDWSEATATIIVLTRDHPALLSRVVTSIRAKTLPGRFRILIVDNDSVTSEAEELRKKLQSVPDVSYLDRPGPFAFSAMCNEAAASAQSDVLVFLNDDTEVVSDGWLDRLVAHAMKPAIGAVGAKLTYPDERLQHVGVVVGMGESAGHFGAFDAGDAPGWAGRNRVLHEVSAVTGACLAVARTKFEAVGGFDAEHLPVELSDIDLCLKLNERGWQTVMEPSVHLMHEESASRGGATFRRLDVYGRQRQVFVDRWRHVLRDDPFFHPGLSLYSWQAALG